MIFDLFHSDTKSKKLMKPCKSREINVLFRSRVGHRRDETPLMAGVQRAAQIAPGYLRVAVSCRNWLIRSSNGAPADVRPDRTSRAWTFVNCWLNWQKNNRECGYKEGSWETYLYNTGLAIILNEILALHFLRKHLIKC